MYEIDKTKLAQEIVAYRFPEGGCEYIKSQVARHQLIFEKEQPENLQDLLEPNEEIFINQNFKAIIGKDDHGEVNYMARYSHSNIITKKEIDELYKTLDSVNVFILHHTDLDGNTAAAITGRVFKDLPTHNKDIVYFHCNYTSSTKQNFLNRLNACQQKSIKTIVIIVDLGLTETDLTNIFSIADRVVFIDHHRTSLAAFMNCSIPATAKVTCLIDTRYSAAYLSYILFADLIKDYTGLEINETFPTMISVMDNAQTKILQTKYISIKVTKSNMDSLKNAEYLESLRTPQQTPSILEDPSKFLGKYIFVKNMLTEDKDEYPNLGRCGMAINNYFIESNDLYPFIYKFYDKMLTDPAAVYNIVQIGGQLKQLELEKLSLLGYNESIYTSSFLGQAIHGVIAYSFNVFSVANNKSRVAQILLKYETNTLLSACVKSYNSILRNTSLSEILEDFFPYTARIQRKFGYKNMAYALTSTKRIDYLFETLINHTLPIELTSKYPNIYEIFDKIHFSIPKEGYKNTDLFKKFFLILSTIVFLVYQTKIQDQLKSLKR